MCQYSPVNSDRRVLLCPSIHTLYLHRRKSWHTPTRPDKEETHTHRDKDIVITVKRNGKCEGIIQGGWAPHSRWWPLTSHWDTHAALNDNDFLSLSLSLMMWCTVNFLIFFSTNNFCNFFVNKNLLSYYNVEVVIGLNKFGEGKSYTKVQDRTNYMWKYS